MYNLIYENKCLPYCKDDTENADEWAFVVARDKHTYEYYKSTIERDYECCSEGYLQRVEASVRINEILAFYHDNPAKSKELMHLCQERFRFTHEKIIPDLKIPNVFRMVKLNREFGLFKRINESKVQVKPGKDLEINNLTTDKLLIITNVPFLTLSKIYKELKSLKGPYLHLKAKNLNVDAKKLNISTIEDEFKFLIEIFSSY